MSDTETTASLRLNYSGACRTCGASLLLTASLTITSAWPLLRTSNYAIECPCCGGVCWFVGEPEKPQPKPPTPLDLTLLDLDLSVRACNVLTRKFLGVIRARRADLEKISLREVTKLSEKEILEVRYAGKFVLADIKQRLAERGLALRSG